MTNYFTFHPQGKQKFASPIHQHQYSDLTPETSTCSKKSQIDQLVWRGNKGEKNWRRQWLKTSLFSSVTISKLRTHKLTYLFVHGLTRTHTYRRTHIHTHTQTHAHTQTHMHVHTDAHKHTHTHTHAHTHSRTHRRTQTHTYRSLHWSPPQLGPTTHHIKFLIQRLASFKAGLPSIWNSWKWNCD